MMKMTNEIHNFVFELLKQQSESQSKSSHRTYVHHSHALDFSLCTLRSLVFIIPYIIKSEINSEIMNRFLINMCIFIDNLMYHLQDHATY